MSTEQVVKFEVSLARAQNWLAVRYSKTGQYPRAAKEAKLLRKHHMEEARLVYTLGLTS